jgi:oxygen-dependent protoporphyrinogen oxidase
MGREVLDRLVQPLIGGIYTGDPNELSLQATLPQFAQMEQEHGSLIRGSRRQARLDRRIERESSGARYELFVTIDEGMDRLPMALAATLPEGSVRVSCAARRVIRPEAGGPWRVELLDGSVLDCAAVVLATEAHAAARLLESHDSELSLHLRSIPYASSIVVHVAYPRDAVAHPLDGFGVVVPAVERRSILAVSFTSVKFAGRAPAGFVLLRVFIGGALQPDLFEHDDSQIEALVRRELGELLGARGSPVLFEMTRHARAMPQYTLGHLERVATIRRHAARHPGLFLTGNAFDGVGIPDCIRAARATADELLAHLAALAKAAA